MSSASRSVSELAARTFNLSCLADATRGPQNERARHTRFSLPLLPSRPGGVQDALLTGPQTHIAVVPAAYRNPPGLSRTASGPGRKRAKSGERHRNRQRRERPGGICSRRGERGSGRRRAAAGGYFGSLTSRATRIMTVAVKWPASVGPGRLLTWGPIWSAAALAALGALLYRQAPLGGVALVVGSAALLFVQLRARRRAINILTSGDIHAVLNAWAPALEQVPHQGTLAPLIAAAAFAAHGQTERAQQLLDRAQRGAAWEAAREQRLLVETLIDAFEGERERAVGKARALAALPAPTATPSRPTQVEGLRTAIGAIARAFARKPEDDDLRHLAVASRAAPVLHWAMRYAAAIIRVDRNEPAAARRLLQGAPVWPEQSVFRDFHRELITHSSADPSE
jgi:hypothetical protein